ncbi:MAG TPA: hypothetical protein VGJ95_07870 [Pseudonocardiaceae bacterium]|jgi:hypothetical protein
MGMGRGAPRATTSALDALTAAEKGELLDVLLAARPDLREQANALAARHLSEEHRSRVADDVEFALCHHDIDELNGRAGYRHGVGYIGPGEAAGEILDEALQPFLDDLARRAELGMTAAAMELAVGIVHGLYQCREGGAESLFEYSLDYPTERASDVVDRCAKLGVDLPVDDLLELMPDWSTLLRRAVARGGRSGVPDGQQSGRSQ